MDKSVPRFTVWHHSAEPRDAKNNDPWDKFVCPYLTLMSDSYILLKKFQIIIQILSLEQTSEK